VLLTGAYQRPRDFNWLIGCGLLGLGVFAGYTGYLLPGDLDRPAGIPTNFSLPSFNR
jgi:quinol-cytochrome oxidoreductase complex cytochrome b subunit